MEGIALSTLESRSGAGSHELPLTAQGANAPAYDDAELRSMIVAFYTRACADEMLGPIFAEHVTDWEAHFDTMVRFWSSAVMRTGGYAGRPIEKHQFGGLGPQHFGRWLELWQETAVESLGAARAKPFTDMGNRMAKSMMYVLRVDR